MEKPEYKNIFDNEEKHFFYVATHNLVLRLIRKYSNKKNLKILDAGCGTGGLMVKLSRLGETAGIDASDEAIKYGLKRNLNVKKASVEKIPFGDNSFDLVTSIDVIYHRQVKDDIEALKEMNRVLKPGGILIIRVPAHMFLMSAHDREVHTARRYSLPELKSKLHQAGFKVEFISYVHAPFFPVSIFRSFWERITGGSQSAVGKINPFINRLITTILLFEARLIASGIVMPFGQGLIATARKSADKVALGK